MEDNKPMENTENTNEIINQVNKKIRTCPHCHQKYEIKSSWDALWRWPTLQEWLILFMMAMMVFAAWAYKHDVQTCKDFIQNADSFCLARQGVHIDNNYTKWSTANITDMINKTVTNETNTTVENQTIIGGQTDSHGCLGPAGYSWNDTEQACVREWSNESDRYQNVSTFNETNLTT